MLQSEFYERTHITLTGEEYADVECLYNAVKMNKDEFCKHWVSEKKNLLFKELAEAYCHEYRVHLADVSQMQAASKSLREDYDKLKKRNTDEKNEMLNRFNTQLNDLARRIVIANNEELPMKSVNDVIEEEFSYAFIIKTKHEAGIPLSESEIDYMVGKL